MLKVFFITFLILPTMFAHATGMFTTGFSRRVSLGGGVPPAAPNAPTVGAPTSSSLVISWTAVSGATSYSIYRSLNSGMTSPISLGVKSSGFTDPSLSGNTIYYYTVTAVNAYGSSSASPPGNATTSVNTASWIDLGWDEIDYGGCGACDAGSIGSYCSTEYQYWPPDDPDCPDYECGMKKQCQ